MRMENIPKPSYYSLECPSCGYNFYRQPDGKLHGGSFISHGERVAISGYAPEGFANPIQLDAITQYFNGSLYRIFPRSKYFSKGGGLLHIHVWEMVFGKRPEGVHIHHRDDEISHNWIGNLECLPIREHMQLTYKRRIEKGTQLTSFSNDARNIDAMPKEAKAGLNGKESQGRVRNAIAYLMRWLGKTENSKSIAPIYAASKLTVKDVCRLNRTADVWCLTVPDTGSWSLANGAIVHNSNPADSLRYYAVEIKEGNKPPKQEEYVDAYSESHQSTAWMA